MCIQSQLPNIGRPIFRKVWQNQKNQLCGNFYEAIYPYGVSTEAKSRNQVLISKFVDVH